VILSTGRVLAVAVLHVLLLVSVVVSTALVYVDVNLPVLLASSLVSIDWGSSISARCHGCPNVGKEVNVVLESFLDT